MPRSRFCCTLIEADAIKEAFERNGVSLEFGPMRRNWAVYRQAREIAQSGELGTVRSVMGFAGNSIGGHFLDTLLYLLGDPEPVSIRGTLGELHHAEGDTANMRFVRDTAILSVYVEFDNGTTLHAAATGASREYELVCESGIIRIQNDGESLCVRKSEEQQRAYDPIEVEPVTPWSGTERKVRELVESIKTGVPGVSNLRATMLGTEIGFGIYESHLQGGVAVPSTGSKPRALGVKLVGNPVFLLGSVDICKTIYNRRGEVTSPIDQCALESPNHKRLN